MVMVVHIYLKIQLIWSQDMMIGLYVILFTEFRTWRKKEGSIHWGITQSVFMVQDFMVQ